VFTVFVDDLQSITTLKTDADGSGVFGVTWTASDYQLNPLNGLAGGITTPYTQVRAIGEYLFPIYEPRNVNANEASVQIAGVWGVAFCAHRYQAGLHPARYETVQALRQSYRCDGLWRPWGYACGACGS
jgi:hypothetical protein